jgi:nucleoside-diphosphate-sugar epimerase
MARTFVLGKELSLVWPRVFFLYGPHEHPKRLVSSVILSLLKNEPALCSHGRQVRDYIHVQDVADGLAAVLDTDATGPVNVCSGEANTLREIVLTVGRLLERPELVRLGALPARANDLPLVVGSAERAKALGFKPRFDLEQGLAHTIEWWRKNRKD